MRATPRLRSIAAGLSAAALALTGIAADPEDACYAVVEDDAGTAEVDETVLACQRDTWIADPTGTKAGNVAITGAAAYPTLVDEEPTASVASPGGASSGAGYLGTSLLQLAEQEPDGTGFTIKGEFTGVLDNLAITLHGMYNGYGSTGSPADRKPMTAYVSMEVDDVPVIPLQSVQTDFTTDAAPTASASRRFRLNVTGLHDLLDAYGIEFGDDISHQLTIRVTPRYLNTDPVVLFLFGTSEVPSGVVLNQVALDPDVVTVSTS